MLTVHESLSQDLDTLTATFRDCSAIMATTETVDKLQRFLYEVNVSFCIFH